MRLETVLWMGPGWPLHVSGGVARPHGTWCARPVQFR